jgi:hypothetical protein
MAQSLHLLCVVMTVPIGLTWYGATGDPVFEIPSHTFEAAGFMLLMLTGLV